MKKYFLILCVALMPLVAFTSCSDDDDDESLAAAVAGTYNVTIGGVPTSATAAAETPQLILSKNTDTSIDFKLAGFGVSGIVIPVDLKGVPVTGTRANVAIDHTTTLKDVELPELMGGKQDIPAKLQGSIKDMKTLDLKITVTVAGLGDIPVTITGTKK